MRDCDQMRDELKAYVDRELSPLRRLAVARHLASCEACRAEAKEMAQITEEIRRDEVTEVDPALRKRFIEEVAAAAPRSDNSEKRGRHISLAGAAACTLLVMFVAAVLFPMFAKVREKARNVSAFSPRYSLGEQMEAQSSPPAQRAPTAPGQLNQKFFTQNVEPETRITGGVVATDDDSLSRKVHKSASLTLQVADPEARSEQIEDMVKSSGGFITNSNLTTAPDGVKTAELAVNVPLPQFETSLAQIAKLRSVQAKNVTGEDITQKVSDAGQRENVLEQDMAEAQSQLKKKGTKAGWQLQEDARDLRIQLAQSRARLRLLKGLSELSEMDITLTQPPKSAPPVQTGFITDIGASGHNAVQSALGALGTLFACVMWILAYAPLWIPAFLIGRWGWRKYQKTMEVAS